MSIGGIEVIEPGAFTTVQDTGRNGFQRYGVPVSGAMDVVALRAANLLVGNEEAAAGLEMTISGPSLRFLTDTVIAITGADLGARLDDGFLPAWQAVPVARGMTVSFRGARAGARGYLSVAGGIDVPEVLGSRSTYVRSRLGGFEGRMLRVGDCLPLQGEVTRIEARAYLGRPLRIEGRSAVLRVVPGPHERSFKPGALETFLSSTYRVSAQSDRMGYRLEGTRLEHEATADIISEGTPPGAVQISGDGLPILLLADRGTAGGYTKIATVVTADLPRVAQLSAGDRVRFAAVDEAEAVSLLRQREQLVRRVAASPPVVYRRWLFSTVVEGQAIEAASTFQVARASGGIDNTPASRGPLVVWVGDRPFEVRVRPLEAIPNQRPPLTKAPGRAALEGAAAVAWASATGTVEPASDIPLLPERPPLGPLLEALPVDVTVAAASMTVEVRPGGSGCRGLVSALGVALEAASEAAPALSLRGSDPPALRQSLAVPEAARKAGSKPVIVRASLPGLVTSVAVRPGEKVSKGMLLGTIEAMKMENPVAAPVSGSASKVLVSPGTQVRAGEALFEIGPA